jgi:hypothetical protein
MMDQKDRLIHAPLIFGLVVQGAAIVWTVSMMMSDIHRNGEDIDEMRMRVGSLESSSQDQAVAFARIEENTKSIMAAIERLATRP